LLPNVEALKISVAMPTALKHILLQKVLSFFVWASKFFWGLK
jgi:hypothetical protein